MSRLRAGQVFDGQIQDLMSEYEFRKIDSRKCSPFWCEFGTGFLVSYPLTFTIGSDDLSDIAIDWFQRTAGRLGFRPWFVSANIAIRANQVAWVSYSAHVWNPVGIMGVGTNFDGFRSFRVPHEDSPELVIGQYSSNGGRDVYVAFTSQATGIEAASVPDFSCVWGFSTCETGFDLFPELRGLQAQIEAHRAVRLSGEDPCPSQNMPARLRNSQTVWLGTFLKELSVPAAQIRVDKVFKNEEPGARLEQPSIVNLRGSTPKLFPHGLRAGQAVIVTSSEDCEVLPADETNLAELNKWLRTYSPPLTDGIPDSSSALPRLPLPAGLR